MGITELTDTDSLPPTISVERAGVLLGISRSSAYRAAERGELPTLRIGRRLLVPSAELLAMLGLPVVPGTDTQAVSPE